MHVSHIILGCRDIQKGDAAAAQILRQPQVDSSTTVSVWQVDLNDFTSVLAFCKRAESQLPRLDGLICNAGIELTRYETSEGFEKTLTINVISTFLMATKLLPHLRKTAKAYSIDTHIEIVGSCIHVFGPDGQLAMSSQQGMLTMLSERKTADMAQRYALSKLMVHQCFNEWLGTILTKEPDTIHQVIATIVNPGWCSTELARSRPRPVFERVMFVVFGRTAEEGSRTLVHGITAGREAHGCYLSECQIKDQSSYVRSMKGATDRKRLWTEVSTLLANISLQA